MFYVKTQSVTNQEFKAFLSNSFHGSDDLFFREIDTDFVQCILAYIDGGSDKTLLEQDIISPLLKATDFVKYDNLDNVIFYSEKTSSVPKDNWPSKIAEGDIILHFNGDDDGLLLSLRKFDKRSISEPPTSNVLKGPREGFIEEIKTNVSMVRRRLKTPDLTVKNLTVGRYSSTCIALMYVDGIAKNSVVDEIVERIKQIDIDGVIDGSYVASFIQGRKYCFFNQVGYLRDDASGTPVHSAQPCQTQPFHAWHGQGHSHARLHQWHRLPPPGKTLWDSCSRHPRQRR